MAAKFRKLCSDGDLEGVRAALQGGANVNIGTPGSGEKGLILALRFGRTAVARLLLEQEGVDVNISDKYGQTLLRYAANSDERSEILAILLSRSDLTPSVNKKDRVGQTPLWWAVKCNAVRCVQLLISDKRVDPNIQVLDSKMII